MTTLLESSVVRIYSNKGNVIGAGFLVSHKHILSCAHVVAQALGIRRDTTELPNGEVYLDFPRVAAGQKLTARVVFWRPVNPLDFEEDIAGLELVSPLPDEARPVRLVTAEDFSGHEFQSFGFPKGNPNGTWAYGALRDRIANGWVQVEGVAQTGYRLEQGFSGTPIWDKELQGVAGMAVSADPDRPEVKAAFIIPTDVLVKAWHELSEQAIPSCPYRGLFAFQEEDAPFFFGRETFTEQLVSAVQKKPLVAVIGPSGSGKSSVVFAGLIPRLQQVGAQGLAPLHIASFRPGDRPLHALASAIIPWLEPQLSKTDQLRQTRQLAADLRQDVGALRDAVEEIVKGNTSARLLLVADQFEELYTLCQDVEERQVFLSRLLEAVNQTRNFNLVLTLRADFLGYALSYRLFNDALQNADVKLGPMNRQELQDAIAKPAEKQGVKLEQGLTERILEAVGEEPGNLPLLEFALTQLWEKQSNGRVTHDAYDAIGGVEQALSNHAEDVYARLTAEEQKQVQKIFIQLVRPGEGTADTRRQATHAEVGEENWDLVNRLADERLVVSDRKKTTGEAEEETVEIVHEALIREWQRLRKWMESDRSFRTWQERLRAARCQWEATDKDDGTLLRGVLLAEAEEWQNRRLDEISQKEQDFIQSSLRLQETEKRQKELQHKRELDLERNRRYLAQGLAAVLGTIAISTTGVLAYPYLLRWQATSLVKTVKIPAGKFEMEVYEVSNEQYHLCVAARACERPKFERRRFDDKNKSKHPVVGVSSVQAADYCRWLGRRLPTELEWEQAARGNQGNGRLWPWGDAKPTRQQANIILAGEQPKSTVPVSNNPDGRSLEGIYNLVGNVWEWTSSYFNETYPTLEQERVWNGEERNLDDRDQLVIRGGSWKDEMDSIANRGSVGGHDGNDFVGIRCVR